MQGPPTTPGISIEDTAQGQPRPQPQSPPPSRPVSSVPPEITDDEPWRQPSIRIRRVSLSQNQSPNPAAARSSAATGRPRAASNSEYRGVRHLSVAAGPEAAPPTPGTDGLLTVEAPSGSTTRARSRSGSGRFLRHESRTLGVPDGRSRATSDPPHMQWDSAALSPAAREGQRDSYLPAVDETAATTDLPTRPQPLALQPQAPGQSDENSEQAGYFGRGRRISSAAGQTYSRFFPTLDTAKTAPEKSVEGQYEPSMVDVLDTIDLEVSTLNTLTNVQNSLFVPDLGRYLNRRPTYVLTRNTTAATTASMRKEEPVMEEIAEGNESELAAERTYTMTSLTSHLDDSHFAVLPHGERLEGWSAEDRAELNDHVRHLLHSRKEKFKRSMKGFGQYVRQPLGFFVTVYATLITLFGLAWVLFLIGWLNVGGRKDYIVNVIDNVLVALFAIIGDGLAPFRAIDTYHMCFIAHYHHLTWRLRREQALPKLPDHNDLPGLGPSWDQQPDTEAGGGEKKQKEYSVLNPNQQKRLVHHQKKFSRSHTFYKPHETETHFAFPLRLLVAVVVLLDCHSLLQIALGTCTWAISYHTRPFALTTVILCCSITCNITAGVVISIGDRKTRKKDVLERMFRQQLTTQAMNTLEKSKKERQSMDIPGANSSIPTLGERNGAAGIDEKMDEAGDAATQASASQPNIHSTSTTTVTGPTITTTTTLRH